MLAIAIGLLLTVAVAVCIVMVVALPHMRNGSRILTPDGERVVERVREQAVQKPVAAAGTTWNGLVAAREKAAKAWEPASTALHEKLDRLESPRADRTGTGSLVRPEADRPRDIRPVEGRPEPDAYPIAPATQPMKVAEPTAKATRFKPIISGPRPVPPISGPIPVDSPVDSREGEPADGIAADQVIDLRESEQAPGTGRPR